MKPQAFSPSKDDEDLTDTEVETEEADTELAEARAAEYIPDEYIPHLGMEDEEVESLAVPYSIRGADDWVSAGTLDPTYEGERKLRYFETWDAAEKWAREEFGDRFKGRVLDAFNSGCPWWAFVIKGPRGADVSK